MEISDLSLPAVNRFASEYLEQSDAVRPFFHYTYNTPGVDRERLDDLASRDFPREKIAAHIESYMSRFGISAQTHETIEKLKRPDSAVVIGGQQAGILTGPLYTIHKVISIIRLAMLEEERLGVPVVPVFWIAGEDHDYHEVNHIYVPSGNSAEKWIFPQKTTGKKMVSDIEIDRGLCGEWVSKIFAHFGETGHTKELAGFIERSLEAFSSYSDFFAALVLHLFKDTGLLIVDSGNKELRQIESSRFEAIINSHAEISGALLRQQEAIRKQGFTNTIEASENSANLFYYDPTLEERILLEFDPEAERFTGKSGSVVFSKDELLLIAREKPFLLSNNVVTRPLMQEWLFPVLAFIGGPGEIAYWAELKQVFEHFSMKMPPIVPRLNITLLERAVEDDIQELGLDIADALIHGTGADEEKFLSSIKDEELDEAFEKARDAIVRQYEALVEKAAASVPSLLPIMKKNESIILSQVAFLEKKLEEALRLKHKAVLDKFARINLALRPDGSPQERVWNIVYYLNKYGPDFVSRLAALDYQFDGKHKVVRL
ncbi:bacillithiol biosynthesis cysteine-adding enzyme BshC [Neobacillus piezotolerans]|uniref:Putative cysteine ligase BshC n=1 Tax=Neobacillus piezotolerans TaxID=2259171 RepID=A0A3D8GVK8_9BACI|nr:bacillithiol biosynthesis cysteine-adding enzyme BshC [Neobacillus piezotolerans]RDU38477.1 bacillithiol biosynthesis cysteine-adding enzyme BshC [Neobacillus piezotolerans]